MAVARMPNHHIDPFSVQSRCDLCGKGCPTSTSCRKYSIWGRRYDPDTFVSAMSGPMDGDALTFRYQWERRCGKIPRWVVRKPCGNYGR
jgi:hypothetical protein